MPEQRLQKTRETLPRRYQFGDGARLGPVRLLSMSEIEELLYRRPRAEKHAPLEPSLDQLWGV
jgi:hypothetical protein